MPPMLRPVWMSVLQGLFHWPAPTSVPIARPDLPSSTCLVRMMTQVPATPDAMPGFLLTELLVSSAQPASTPITSLTLPTHLEDAPDAPPDLQLAESSHPQVALNAKPATAEIIARSVIQD